MEAVILAGGMGTRLQSVWPNQQKCMAPVAGKPFLYYVVRGLSDQGVDRIILATGYQHTQISDWLAHQSFPVDIVLSIEAEPMGTGGAFLQALSLVKTETTLVCNGDSFIPFDLNTLQDFHQSHGAAGSLVVTPIEQADRFGSIELASNGQVLAWNEKTTTGASLVNAGLYLFTTAFFADMAIRPCSLEQDLLPAFIHTNQLYGMPVAGPLLDIGTPDAWQSAATYVPDAFRRD
jgi:D-glycero-alpha-D-manno-heptose 1-phosphate guanylyltransferase